MSKKNISNAPLLGSGSYSRVFLVEHHKKEYAVKCPETDQNGVISPLEIDILRRFKHPHLIHAEFFHVLAESCNYLHFWLPRGKKYTSCFRTGSEEARLFWQLATGLSFLHQHNILHLDLDLANIISREVDGEEIYQIIDFGLAKYCPNKIYYSSRTATILSSRPPELLQVDLRKGKRYPFRPACDIWSLGLIFLRIISQEENLYRRRTIIEQYNCFKQYFETPKLAYSTIKAWVNHSYLIDLLVKMLAWQPEDRLSIEEVLTHPYFTSRLFVRPVGEVVIKNYYNTDLNLDIYQDLLELITELVLLNGNLPIRIVLRGVDLFYRTISTTPKLKFLQDAIQIKFYLLVSFILSCKLNGIFIKFISSQIDPSEYIEAEKVILARLQGYLCSPFRSTLYLRNIKEYANGPIIGDYNFSEKPIKTLISQLAKLK